MNNKKQFGWIALFAIVILAFAVISVAGAADPESAQAESTGNNVESGTWCWFGLCGHQDKYTTILYDSVTHRSYIIDSEGTDYEYIGRFIAPGGSASISIGVEYSSGVSGGLGVEYSGIQASLGLTNGWSDSYSFTYTVNNDTNTRQYVHAAVEYEERISCGVRIEKRWLNPRFRHQFFNAYCLYNTICYYPQKRVSTGVGYELLPNKMYSSDITVRLH